MRVNFGRKLRFATYMIQIIGKYHNAANKFDKNLMVKLISIGTLHWCITNFS